MYFLHIILYMKRRVFCKASASMILAWGLNPIIAFANPNNQVLSGKIFVNKKLVKNNLENLGNVLIETKKTKAILKIENDFYLVRPNTKLKFVSNQLKEIIVGSVHAVFGKREEELKIKIPQGTIGIRGTSIFVNLEPEKQRSYLCNCSGHTKLYDNSGKLLKSLISKDHKPAVITDAGEIENYSYNYLFNLYALRHASIFEKEMKEVGCEVKDSHCTFSS